jgi:hypothetical protein
MEYIINSKKHGEFKCLIDEDDFERFKHYRIGISFDGFCFVPRISIKGKCFFLHRVIMDCPKGLVVDHINHNTLDNRKENLRICTYTQNKMNSQKHNFNTSSKYKGVYRQKNCIRFNAMITVNKKHIYLGGFENEIDAAIAYNNAALIHFGEFAFINKFI